MRTPRTDAARGPRAEPLPGGSVLEGRSASAGSTPCRAGADSLPGRSGESKRKGLRMTSSTAQQTVALAPVDIWLPSAGTSCLTPDGSSRPCYDFLPLAFRSEDGAVGFD